MPIAGLEKSSEKTAKIVQRPLSASVMMFLRALRERESKKNELPEDVPVIHVSSVVSGAAQIYERLRYSVDFHEEHLLRRHALRRILRRYFDSLNGVADAARLLLVELVHALYVPNDSLPESAVEEVQAVLDRYAAIFAEVESSLLKDKSNFIEWFLGVAAAELDGMLVPAPEEAALVGLLMRQAEEDQSLRTWQLDDETWRTQTMIASYRALYALDLGKLHYLLLCERLPNWLSIDAKDIPELFPVLLKHHKAIEEALRYPAGERLYRAFKKRSLVFHALGDIVTSNLSTATQIFVDERKLIVKIEEVCRSYYKGARRRLYRGAIRSTVYIFLTKIALAMAVEAPLEAWLFGAWITLPLIINVAFPPALMFLLTATTRLPKTTNTQQVVKNIRSILYGDEHKVFPELPKPLSPATGSRGVLTIIYLLVFVLTFGAIVTVLRKYGFTPIGIGFFLFFLSIVSFFALRIRQPVRDLYVIRRRENVFVAVLDFFSLPILKVGRWISLTSSRFNVFLYLFDYFLEAPVKSVLLLTEDVLGFFREKREDIL